MSSAAEGAQLILLDELKSLSHALCWVWFPHPGFWGPSVGQVGLPLNPFWRGSASGPPLPLATESDIEATPLLDSGFGRRSRIEAAANHHRRIVRGAVLQPLPGSLVMGRGAHKASGTAEGLQYLISCTPTTTSLAPGD